MSIKNKIVAAALSGLAIAGIVAATSLSFPQSTSAQTSTPAAPTTTTTVPAGRDGRLGDIKGGGTYLAQALGITETDLQAAQTKAREAEIKQAVADGLITQAQADAMLNGTGGHAGCASTSGARTSITRSSWPRPWASRWRSCRLRRTRPPRLSWRKPSPTAA